MVYTGIMTTKIVMAQPALSRYQWELDTAITSIRELTDLPIVLLFIGYDIGVIQHFNGRYEGLEIHHYPEGRDYTAYPANTRPWLMWQYLSEDRARESVRYFQIDSDVIFREWPDLSKLNKKCVLYGSDCGGYIDYDYLVTRKNGSDIIQRFASIVGLEEDAIKGLQGVGAQFVFRDSTAEMWQEIYQKSNELWQYLEPVDSDIQKWTAEMWAQLYVFAKHGFTPSIEDELDFCRPTDDARMWGMTKMLHNAGVVGLSAAGLLYKGQYTDKSPFNEDLSWVRRDKAGWYYARAIDKAAGKL